MFRGLITTCLLFLIHSSLIGQFKDISRPDAPDRFMAFVSPMTTAEDIDTLRNTLEGFGFRMSIKQLTFTTDGQLISFFARIAPECDNEGFVYEGMTDFAKKEEYQIAALFIGEDCSTGVFTTSHDNMKNMYGAFFPTKDPEYILYGWQGDFEAAKDVSLAANFTVATKEDR